MARRWAFADDLTRRRRAARYRSCGRLHTARKALRLRSLLWAGEVHRFASRHWASRLGEADAPCDAQRCADLSGRALSECEIRWPAQNVPGAAGRIARASEKDRTGR